MNTTRKNLFRVLLIASSFIALGLAFRTGQSKSMFSLEPLPTIEATLRPGVEWVTVRSLPVEASTIWQENGQVFAFSRPIIDSARDAALYQELVEGRLDSLPDDQVLTAEVTFKDSLSLTGIESLLEQYTIISLLASGEDGSTGHVAYPPEEIPAEFQGEFSQVYEALSGGTPAPSLSPDNYIAATLKANVLLLRTLAQKERIFTVDVGPIDLLIDFPEGNFSTLKDVSYDYELHVGSLCEFTLLRNRINELSASGEIPTVVRDELIDILTSSEAYLNTNDVASARSEMTLYFETLTENSATISENALRETSIVGDCLLAREMQSNPVVSVGNDQTVDLGNSVTINATYSDADHSEEHSARIDWGDETIEDVLVSVTGPGAGEVTGQHTYADLGDYTVDVCVTDLYGGVGCDTTVISVHPAGGFPSTSILDNFNRANGPIGSNWSGYKTNYEISSNQLRVKSSGSNTDIYWSASAFGLDQEAYVTFSDLISSASEQDLLLKSQSASTWGNGVLEVWYDAPHQRVKVYTYKWPQGWLQHGADIPVTFVDGDTFGARARPDGMVEVYRNGELLATRDITAWLHYDDGGYIGLWFAGAYNARLDDFGGGTVSGGESLRMPVSGPSGEIEDGQLNVELQDADVFWQGVPLGTGQEASVTFAMLPTEAQGARRKPQSNGIWGEGVAQVLYDVDGQQIRILTYDAQKGWVQYGNNIHIKFVAGDKLTVRALADGTIEIYRNGKLLAKRDVTP